MVDLRSSFEQTMIGQSPRCYIQRFVEICLPAMKNVLKGGFTIYVRGSHLGNVTSIIYINFHFIVSKSLQNQFG